jgi:hypothetical protein
MLRFLRFFVSRTFGLVIHVVLPIVLILVTIAEARAIDPPTPFPAYLSWWFIVLLGVFCLNILGVFLRPAMLRLDRWPNQFVHQGLVLVLVGSAVTYLASEEGFVRLPEGRTTDSYFGDEPQLVLEAERLRRRVEIDDIDDIAGRVFEAPGGERFQAVRTLPSAKRDPEDESRIVPDQDGRSPRGLLLRRMADGTAFWIFMEGPPSTVGPARVSLTRRRRLGFRLTLLEATRIDWPASGTPRAYYSRVRIDDPDRGLSREWMVETNAPLSYGGFRFYQSTMEPGPGASISGFQVKRDPGLLWVTIGICLFGLGLLVLFARKFVRDPLAARRERRRVLPTPPEVPA